MIIAVLASCKKAPKEANFIPKDASYVLAFDGKSLNDKIEKGGITQDSIISMFHIDTSKMDAKSREMANDIKNSGVDFREKIYIFAKQEGGMQNMNMGGGIVATLNDKAKFEAFVKKHVPDAKIVAEKEFSYVLVQNDFVLSWNDKTIIGIAKSNGGSTASIAEAKRLYTLKADESMASVTQFTDLMKENADAYFFSSTNASLGMMSAMPFQLPKLTDLLKDNYTTATINFNDGEVEMKSKFWPNEKLKAIFDKNKGHEISLDAIKTFPATNLNGFAAVAFNPNLLADILKELEVAGVADGFMSRLGFTTGDVIKAMKGDVTFMVGDFSLVKKTIPNPYLPGGTYETTKPEMKLIARIDIGDKASFTKIMDAAVAQKLLVKAGNVYTSTPEMQTENIFVQADDKMLLISTDQATITQYVAGTAKLNLNSDVESKVKGSANAFYVDLIKTLTAANASNTGESAEAMNIAISTFKDAYATGKNFDGKNLEGTAKLRFVDEKTNSLVSLIKMGAKYKKMSDAQEAKWSTTPLTDSIMSADTVAPVIEAPKVVAPH